MTRVLVMLLVSMAAVLHGQSTPASPQHGRLFSPKDLGLLESPDRDIWQKPEQIMDALGIAEGSAVADVGAGSGWFTMQLARRVGPNGTVFSQDVQPEMIAAISRRVKREGLTNVVTRQGKGSAPNLPRGRLDAVLLVGVYHEIEDRVQMLKNLADALKPQGRIGVVDFTLRGGGPGPPTDERIDPAIVVNDAASAGLRLVSQETFLPYQYLLIFDRRAADATRSAAPGSRGKP